MMRLQHGWELNLTLLNPAFPDLGELKNNYVLGWPYSSPGF